MSNITDHLDDIDFRNHAERQKSAIPDFMNWYDSLYQVVRKDPNNVRISAQLAILSAVLWYLMEPKQYKRFMKGKLHENSQAVH